jgi:hypothetical protein
VKINKLLKEVSMSLLLIVLILLLIFGGTGGYYGYNRGYYGPGPFSGLVGVLVLLIILYLIFGGVFSTAVP